MSITSLLLLLVSVFSAVSVDNPQIGPKSALAGVDISYVLSDQARTLHEPVILTFKVSNRLPNAIVLDLGQNRENGFAFNLLRPDGSTADSASFTRNASQVHKRYEGWCDSLQDAARPIWFNSSTQLSRTKRTPVA
jgi:hypothetical protein